LVKITILNILIKTPHHIDLKQLFNFELFKNSKGLFSMNFI